MATPPKDDEGSLDAIYRYLGDLADSAIDHPGTTLADLAKGAARGVAEMPFDIGATIAPGIGLIAPTTARALGPLDDQVKALLARSPLATTGPAGDLGSWLAQMLAPVPGGGRLATEAGNVATLLASRLAH
jgi:hypothetical protein